MKKAWQIFSRVLVWLLVIFTLAVMVFTILSVNTVGRHDRSIFGYKAYIVLTDSMRKTDFAAGDLVLVEEVDPATLKPGDIIAFISENSHNRGQVVTHKIRQRITMPNGEPGFITYGTTSNENDEKPVGYPFIQGKHALTLPKVGKFFNFLRTTPGYLVCILLPFLLIIGYEALVCVRLFRRYRSEQLSELRQERQELEQERQRSQEMLAQLEQLKAQLNGKPPEEETEEETEDGPAEAPEEETEKLPEGQAAALDSLSLDAIIAEFSEKEEL